jgi:poly[(R)-3-hydroxyalkanoate] polymerase subunit PhaC
MITSKWKRSTSLGRAATDHIVPWKAAYASTQLLPGDTMFVFGASGQIAGVINPPTRHKRNYWSPDSADAGLDADADRWFDTADSVPGSWWAAWIGWLAPHSGPKVNARKKLGDAEFTPIEEASGSYVTRKA